MSPVLQFIVGLILSLVVSRVMGWPWIYGIGAVAILWMMSQGGGAGIVSGISGAVRGTVVFFKRLVVGTLTFLGLMMLVSRVIDVPFAYATGGFRVLGPAPWNWPTTAGLPILLFISLAFLAAWVAIKAAEGNAKIAGSIFGVSAIIIFTMMSLPRHAEVVRPKSATGPATPLPGETQAWADTDQSLSERGAILVAVGTTWRFLFGSSAGRAWSSVKGGISSILPTRTVTPPSTPSPATAPSTAVPVEALLLEKECATPCSADIRYKFRLIWGDSPLRVTYQGGQIVDYSGKDRDFQAPSNMTSGETKFESLDPGNPNFRVQVYRVVVR